MADNSKLTFTLLFNDDECLKLALNIVLSTIYFIS